MTLIVWTLVLCVLMYGPVTEACPSGCSCERSTECNGTFVGCAYKGLTEVPTNIPTDTCVLYLNGNQITTIPDNAFNGLPNLQTLYLERNQITTIPDNAFNGLPNLQILWLFSNKITTIPDNAFNGLPNLKELDLGLNQITTIPENAFKGLPNLQKLYLQGNQITTIPDNAFNGLPNLQTLWLENNQITTISENAFNGMPNLQTLNLYSNEITVIEDNAFKGLQNLSTLLLHGNNITVLSKRFFKDLPTLEKITVEENPLHCDCILAEFVSFVKSRNIKLRYNDDPRCVTPSNLRGLLLPYLAIEEMDCYLNTGTTTLLETTDVPEIETVKVEKGLPVITIAYIITVPGLLILCFGVNFISYKWGMKKGQKKERKRHLLRSKENAQGGDYQHYFNDDEEMKARSLRTRGYPAAEFQDPSHDYADYDEIKDQKFEAMLAEEKGYSAAEYESRNRPLPPIKADDDGYSVHVDDRSPEPKTSSTSNGSPSPPGNGGYLSPLQEEKEAEERLVSTNSDSSSNKSEKSEKSRKYQNEPPCDSSSQPITPYELIKNTEDSKDHQYIKLRTNST